MNITTRQRYIVNETPCMKPNTSAISFLNHRQFLMQLSCSYIAYSNLSFSFSASSDNS